MVGLALVLAVASNAWATAPRPVRHDGGVVYINMKGQRVFDRQFESGRHFVSGLARVRIDGLWGYIDRAGRIVIEPQFIYANDFQDGIARVGTGDTLSDREYAFIDVEGKVWGEHLPKSPGGRVMDFSEGIASIWADDRNLLVNRSAEIVLALDDFILVHPFSEGAAVVMDRQHEERDERLRFIRPDGSMALEGAFAQALPFSEGLASVEVDGRWHYIDYGGEKVFGRTFASALPFSEGRALIADVDEHGQRRYGFIDRSGFDVVEPRFVDAGEYTEGLAAVAVDGEDEDEVLWGFIDHDGTWVIPPEYAAVQSFRAGVARVRDRHDNRLLYINRKGEVIWPEGRGTADQ